MGITLLIIGLVAALIATAYVKKVQGYVKILTAAAILATPIALALGVGVVVVWIWIALTWLALLLRGIAWVINKISSGVTWISDSVLGVANRADTNFRNWVITSFQKLR